jgi:hypothetical protein
MIIFAFALAATAATTDDLPPFDFAGIYPGQPVSFNAPEFSTCAGTIEKGFCSLNKESFADVKITNSTVEIKQGYVRSIIISIMSFDYNDALAALKAKYGQPAGVDGNFYDPPKAVMTRWRFKDGTFILSTESGKPTSSLMFISNRKDDPKIDF